MDAYSRAGNLDLAEEFVDNEMEEEKAYVALVGTFTCFFVYLLL